MTVQIGQEAPDFELRDQTGQPVRLSDYRGKKHVVIVFYPLSFTGVCEAEMCGIRDSVEVFRNEEVETLAISVDAPPTHQRWAHEQGFDFPLLSDFWPHGEVAQAYGVFDERLGTAIRGTFIVDRDGMVAYTDNSPVPHARDQDAWKDALREIGAIP
ncbi:peroxiredoxin [Egicoccus sp. AB-alg6-2]|uniref:peroxiredoxin n=1 Tax=Egicoccus sp. AB-alg6-2 TaxID=3242692 RepID=UPI00359DCB0F